ncbi:hypothetical protein K432DRAFT_392715 [Lepidopterella palustris CBS 459.81]|uniref:Uncharacterized protein n=1 Tax=Lepidopterella palustris CBS 459.81 TaxID=1314670 RepID=A0A8E2EB93_9PEZI|nr:hypothetical protein K432DRAFT_392715 [Lepidopterella palustris CBS 459.81]
MPFRSQNHVRVPSLYPVCMLEFYRRKREEEEGWIAMKRDMDLEAKELKEEIRAINARGRKAQEEAQAEEELTKALQGAAKRGEGEAPEAMTTPELFGLDMSSSTALEVFVVEKFGLQLRMRAVESSLPAFGCSTWFVKALGVFTMFSGFYKQPSPLKTRFFSGRTANTDTTFSYSLAMEQPPEKTDSDMALLMAVYLSLGGPNVDWSRVAHHLNNGTTAEHVEGRFKDMMSNHPIFSRLGNSTAASSPTTTTVTTETNTAFSTLSHSEHTPGTLGASSVVSNDGEGIATEPLRPRRASSRVASTNTQQAHPTGTTSSSMITKDLLTSTSLDRGLVEKKGAADTPTRVTRSHSRGASDSEGGTVKSAKDTGPENLGKRKRGDKVGGGENKRPKEMDPIKEEGD